MTKLFLLGLDGASFNILKPMIDSNNLPNLGKITNEGLYSTLISTYPPVTCPAWTSLATGKNPGKTGIFDVYNLVSKDTFNFSIMNSNDIRKNKPFWDYLSIKGYKVAVLNYPFLYPPYQINGIMSSGLGSSPEDSIFYPENLKDKIYDLINEYKIDIPYMDLKYLDDMNAFIDDCIKLLDSNNILIDYFLNNNDYDLIVFIISVTDFAQHFMYKYVDKKHPNYDHINSKQYYIEFIKIWKKVDDIIGNIIEAIEKDGNLLIVSDHGFGPHTKNFYLNIWLKDQNYLYTNRYNIIPRTKLTLSRLLKVISPKMHSNILNYLKKNDISPRLEKSKNTFSEINLSKTIAFMPINTSGTGVIYINDNLVSKKDKIQLIKKIKSELDKYFLERKIKISFIDKNEIYSGDKKNMTGDILFYLNNFEIGVIPALTKGENIRDAPKSHSGIHRMKGVFIAYGKDVNKNIKNIDANIMDICPTILSYFDQPIPRDIDGKALTDIFIKENKFN